MLLFLSQHATKKTLSIRERIFLLLGSVITLIMVLHKWGIISARALLKIVEGGEALDSRAAFVAERERELIDKECDMFIYNIILHLLRVSLDPLARGKRILKSILYASS